MNILFVVDSLSDVAGANVNIVKILIGIIRHRDCKVHVLAKSDCKRPISDTLKAEFDFVYLLPSDKVEIVPNLYKMVNAHNPKLKEMIWLLNHPGVFWKAIDSAFFDAICTRKEYSKNIEKICENSNIDVVIGVAAPYCIARAVSEANVKALKTVYQLDPYTNNYTLSIRKRKKRKRIERKTIDLLDVLFLPDFVKNDIEELEVSVSNDKFVETNLPGIVVDNLYRNNTSEKLIKNKKTTEFVFAGRLYDDIRNPKPLLQLFAILPDNYKLHILGSGCEKEIKQYKKVLGDKLIYHGLVSKREADNYVEKADVLINIDNTIKNQMPSKVLEYICQQKRIINICLDETCLAARLVLKYENGINICINSKSMYENAEIVKTFLRRDIGMIKANDVISNYEKYTDQFVAKTILETIYKLCDLSGRQNVQKFGCPQSEKTVDKCEVH